MCINGQNTRRKRRDVNGDGEIADVTETDENLTIEVFSGLYVNEEEEVSFSHKSILLFLSLSIYFKYMPMYCIN